MIHISRDTWLARPSTKPAAERATVERSARALGSRSHADGEDT